MTNENTASQPKAASIADAIIDVLEIHSLLSRRTDRQMELLRGDLADALKSALSPDRTALADAQITAGSNILCDCPEPKRIGRNAAIDVFQAMGAVAQDDLKTSTLKFMIGYMNDDPATYQEISDAFDQQKAVWSFKEFADCYCARKMRDAIAAPQPVAAAQAVPNGVYYAEYADNFYCMMSKQAMGREFYSQWVDAKESFPTEGFRAKLSRQPVAVPQPVGASKTVPEVMVSAAGRSLSDRNAVECNVDKDDNWKEFGLDFIEDARFVLQAAGFSIEAAREVTCRACISIKQFCDKHAL